jgi:hypothetical protein
MSKLGACCLLPLFPFWMDVDPSVERITPWEKLVNFPNNDNLSTNVS